jgi:alcohol dehydrogenase (cytochrome c)
MYVCLPSISFNFESVRGMNMNMNRKGYLDLFCCLSLGLGFVIPGFAQSSDFTPVTQAMLENPSDDDWLMLSRTFDQQRYSPLAQINQNNVSQLRLAWSRGLTGGMQQTIPIVYNGVMYVVSPVASILALDATNGDLIWEYNRTTDPRVSQARIEMTSAKSLAIFADLVYFTAPDGYLVALNARDGSVRWEVLAHEPDSGAKHTSAPIVVEGKVITGRACQNYASCYLAAHDAITGKEIWKFYTAAAEGQPGGDSWGKVPTENRNASLWGLPGSYDPVRKLIYWGTANPRPYTRLMRHGSAEGTSRTAPADLYTNSTLALDQATGELAWYYQHLPGDDWDADHAHERILLRTKINPDPKAVKWINPGIKRGEERDVVVHVAEAGGLWVLDRATGEFLWAMPFPEDVPEFNISNIEVTTGITEINWDIVFKKDGDSSLICFQNTRSYWPMAYHLDTNSLYIAYHDYCLEMTARVSSPEGYVNRVGRLRPGVDLDKAHVFAKVNMMTGEITRLHESGVPANGAVLATAGNLVFWGDMNRRFRAFDTESGKIMWESILGGVIQMSTITYAVNGKQYVAVMTGDGASGTRNPYRIAELTTPRGHNEIYVFALP